MVKIFNKIISSFTSEKRLRTKSDKLISTIFMLINNSKEIQLLVVNVSRILKIRGKRFVEFRCQDCMGKKYNMMLSENTVNHMIKSDSIFKKIDENDSVFIKEIIK